MLSEPRRTLAYQLKYVSDPSNDDELNNKKLLQKILGWHITV